MTAYKETVTSYDFAEDAMGLGDFIAQSMSDPDVSPVVYVTDGEGYAAARADWVVSTLSDGTKVAELQIHFTKE